MIADTSPGGNPAGRGGLFTNVFASANSIARFVETRLELLAKESKSALLQLLALAAAIVAAVLMLGLGYVFLIGTVIFVVVGMTQISWVWVALIAAGLHFLFAFICLLIARAMATKPPFRETAAELKKDREWIKNLDGITRTTSSRQR